MTNKLILTTFLASISLSSAACAGPSAQHLGNASEHAALASAHGAGSSLKGAASVAAVPLLVVGSAGLAVGSAGVAMAEFASEPLLLGDESDHESATENNSQTLDPASMIGTQ